MNVPQILTMERWISGLGAFLDEPLARPRPRRENGEEKEQDPGALSIVRLESRYEKTIPIAQWEAKYMLT